MKNHHDYPIKSLFRKELTVASRDQYFNAATVSAHPTNPIQLSAAVENRSIQGFDDCVEVLYFKKRVKQVRM